MTKRDIITNALANSLLTALYVILIGIFMGNGEKIFGGGKDTALIPIAMLLLFVFSAAVCGTLIFGRPILWYLDGKKKEAVTLFGYTLAFFFGTALIVFAVLFMVMR